MSIFSKQIARFLHKSLSWLVILSFALNTVLPAYAESQVGFSLPAVGEQVALSPAFSPVLLKAVKVNPDNPFQFDFIIDIGSSNLQGDELRTEAQKLIRYFLASLTTPENDLWVNLSPYEKERIIPQSFGTTEMGRDLLGEDYLLKQITATLLYPEGELGKKYWGEINKIRTLDAGRLTLEKNSSASVQPQTTNTFNKVWIVPQKAVVYENGATAYVDETYLKVMMEEDYMALQNSISPPLVGGARGGGDVAVKNSPRPNPPHGGGGNIDGKILHELILPELEKEVNEGKNFASLRQIYNSLILANWYKKRLKDSILSQIYVDKNKVTGIDLDDKEQAKKIYNQYVEAFKKGVYNYIKEDYDPLTQETVPRKYFSGGMGFASSSAATQYRQGLPENAGVASSGFRKITVDTRPYDTKELEDKEVLERFAKIQAQNNDKARLAQSKNRVYEVFNLSGLKHIDFASMYEASQSVAHTPAWGGVVAIQPLLTKFIDDVFEKALDFDDPKATQIVFLQAGAQPIYEAAVLMAKVTGVFPAENLKSVWGTMGNYRQMKDDKEQRLLFIKYLHDQGVFSPKTKHLLIVDTDAGIVEIGTAAIFAKTLLDNDVLQTANQRFGLNIKPFNEVGGENTLDFSYLYSAYVASPAKREIHIKAEKISGQIDAKLRIEGYNDNTSDIDQAIRISNLWYPVDSFVKTANISDRFSLDQEGRSQVTFLAPNKQPYDNLKILNLLRTVEDIGLLIGTLNVMSAKGFYVAEQADQLVERLEDVFKTSGVTQADIDASKPQQGYRASSSIALGTSAKILLSPQDLARSEVVSVLHTIEDSVTGKRRMTLEIKSPDGKTFILKLYSKSEDFNNESLGYAVAEKLGMHVPKHQEFEESSDFDGLVKQAVKVGNLLQEFTQPYGLARLIEQVQEYKTDKPYNGLEELVVFTHLMHFEDYDKLKPQQIFSRNIFFTKDGKYVVYDYETEWDVDFSNNYFSKYKDVAYRIDQGRLENAIKVARKLTADDFRDLLVTDQSRQNFQKRVESFEEDMIRQLGYFRDEPQAVRLLEIVKNMPSSSAVGGIDLTSAKTPLDIRGQSEPVEFNFDPQQLQNIQFDGLVPVIINIVPVVNLPQFLTEKPLSKPAAQLSRSN